MSKKNIILLASVFILVMVVAVLIIALVKADTGLKHQQQQTDTIEAVREFNLNSNLKSRYGLLTPLKIISEEDVRIYEEGAGEFTSTYIDAGNWIGEFANDYQYSIDEKTRITEMSLSRGGECDFLGVKVGDDISIAEATLKKFGYTSRELNDYDFGIYTKKNQFEKTYCKYNLTIRCHADNESNQVERIIVQLIDYTSPPPEPVDYF